MIRKNWFIYAYPERYGGLHGMYNYDVVWDISEQEACDWGYEMAYETVESYLRADEVYSTEDFMDDYYNGEEWNDCYEQEYWDAYAEVMEEECAYEIFPLKDDVTEQDWYNWQKENMGPEDFINRYCRQLTIEDC